MSQSGSSSEEITWDQVAQLMDELKGVARSLLIKRNDFKLASSSSLVLTALRRQKRADAEFTDVTWPNRAYFFKAIYTAMERALVDRSRKRNTQRQISTVSLSELQVDSPIDAVDDYPDHVEALVQALESLDQSHPKWAQVVRHRYYGQLKWAEIAELMEVAERTVRRHFERAELVLKSNILQILNSVE